MTEKETSPTDDTPTELRSGRSSRVGKAAIAGFVGIVIAVECVIAYFWIPSAKQIEATAKARMTENLREIEDPDVSQQLKEEVIPVVEVDMGNYSITAHQPTSGVTLRIDFHLIGTVEEGDESDFEALFGVNKHRLRDQIIFEIRNSQITDLTDPGLGLIKRRILEKSNALFGKTLIRSVVVSEFSFVEQ